MRAGAYYIKECSYGIPKVMVSCVVTSLQALLLIMGYSHSAFRRPSIGSYALQIVLHRYRCTFELLCYQKDGCRTQR